MAKEKKPPAESKALPPLWRYWDVRLEFFSRVYGAVPADAEVINAWLNARKPTARPPGGRSIDEVAEEVLATLSEQADEAEKVEYQMLVFQYDPTLTGDRPICFRSETLRAHHKDCARVLSGQYMGRLQGERSFATKVISGLYPAVTQRWIPLMRPDGTPITKPDTEVDKFVHPRSGVSALKKLSILEPPVVVKYRLQTLGDSIKAADLGYLFEYGGVHGYGGERSQDGGKYTAIFKETTNG